MLGKNNEEEEDDEKKEKEVIHIGSVDTVAQGGESLGDIEEGGGDSETIESGVTWRDQWELRHVQPLKSSRRKTKRGQEGGMDEQRKEGIEEEEGSEDEGGERA